MKVFCTQCGKEGDRPAAEVARVGHIFCNRICYGLWRQSVVGNRIHVFQSGDLIDEVTFVKYLTDHKFPSKRRALFICKCGNEFIATVSNVSFGSTRSCGCARIGTGNVTHRLTKHLLYKTWAGIKTRCYDPNTAYYKHYGGRGICISGEFHYFPVWLDYVTSLPRYNERAALRLTIDRIDNDGNYERGNLRWATQSQQMQNTRRSKNVMIL